jgi:polyphosphate kinase
MNALVDKPMIQLLYQASQVGVKVDLLVRGICCLRPGLPGISENIRVISIVGRFLEHSRLYYFHNNGEEEMYLGSADLMPRNIDHRVEVLFPIENPQLIQHLRDDVLNVYLCDNAKARRLLADGVYETIAPKPDQPLMNSQAWLIAHRPNQAKVEEL